MDDFTRAAEITESPAKVLRDDLVKYGLISVTERPVRGASILMTIEPTELGRRVGESFAEARRILRQADDQSDRVKKQVRAASRAAQKALMRAEGREPPDE